MGATGSGHDGAGHLRVEAATHLRRAAAVLVAAVLALLAGAALQPVAATALDPVEDCYPVPEDGCPPLDGAIEARVLGPYCEQDVPHLRWDLDVPGSDATSTTLTFVDPDGEDLVYRDQPLAGTLIWPGAEADASGEGTNWPGWEYRDGQWVEVDDGYAFTRDDVVIRFDVAPGYEAVVPYPPPTSACADPTQVREVVLERPVGGGADGDGQAGVGVGGGAPTDAEGAAPTPRRVVQVAGATLPFTGAEATLLAAAGLAALGIGTMMVMRGRRRRGEGAAGS